MNEMEKHWRVDLIYVSTEHSVVWKINIERGGCKKGDRSGGHCTNPARGDSGLDWKVSNRHGHWVEFCINRILKVEPTNWLC